MTTSNPVRRISSIIDAVAAAREGITLAAIGNAVDLSPSTVHRTVNILMDVGYLKLEPSTKTYRLGERLKRVLLLSQGTGSLEKLAQPALVNLAERFTETAYLVQFTTIKGLQLVDFYLPTTGSRTLVHPGFDFPMHATAAGKVVYAFQADEVIEKEFTRGIERFMPNTLTSRKAILGEMKKVRARGYAVNDVELDPGVYAVAAPLTVDEGRTVVGALAIAGIRDRLLSKYSEREIANDLLGATAELSRLMVNIDTEFQ